MSTAIDLFVQVIYIAIIHLMESSFGVYPKKCNLHAWKWKRVFSSSREGTNNLSMRNLPCIIIFMCHILHVWNIYQDLPQKLPKCRYIFHTQSIWVCTCPRFFADQTAIILDAPLLRTAACGRGHLPSQLRDNGTRVSATSAYCVTTRGQGLPGGMGGKIYPPMWGPQDS